MKILLGTIDTDIKMEGSVVTSRVLNIWYLCVFGIMRCLCNMCTEGKDITSFAGRWINVIFLHIVIMWLRMYFDYSGICCIKWTCPIIVATAWNYYSLAYAFLLKYHRISYLLVIHFTCRIVHYNMSQKIWSVRE